MSPLVLEIASAVVRALLLWFGSRLVENGILTHEQSDKAVEAGLKHAVHYLPLVALIAWSAWAKWKKHLDYIAARLLSVRATEAEVQLLAKQPVVRQLAFVDPATIGVVTPPPPLRPDSYD